MEVKLAQSAGFCYGVRRAVELAEQAAEEGRCPVMLGSVIHNRHVIDSLLARGDGVTLALMGGWLLLCRLRAGKMEK